MGNQQCQDAQKELAEQLTDLTERFDVLKIVHHEILKRAKQYHNYGVSVHLTIMIIGAVSAAQATVRNQIGADSKSIILLFTVLAILMTIGAGLESFFKWSKKSGALCSLAAGCAVLLSRRYDHPNKAPSEHATERNQSSLCKILNLADDDLKAVNRKILEVQNRVAELGMTDLALKVSDLDEGIVRDQLGHKIIEPSSDGNGGPREGQAILSTSTEIVALLVRERH
jgi:hypothetical protein